MGRAPPAGVGTQAVRARSQGTILHRDTQIRGHEGRPWKDEWGAPSQTCGHSSTRTGKAQTLAGTLEDDPGGSTGFLWGGARGLWRV